ncbi:hypothetical protein IWQ62_000952 [Dispira parvispora]|uniref:ELYS-like domain-containing protein n=1 Tax=Dispira parvispora TaxID=1520584 RepID=A0A9W8AZ38_9FUNG|nr:hypothetical protein IWQ62_000952 [Dispira parvispora]
MDHLTTLPPFPSTQLDTASESAVGSTRGFSPALQGGFGDASPALGHPLGTPTWYYSYSSTYLEVRSLTPSEWPHTSASAKGSRFSVNSGVVQGQLLASLHVSQLSEEDQADLIIAKVVPGTLGSATRFLMIVTQQINTEHCLLFFFDPLTVMTYPLPYSVPGTVTALSLSEPVAVNNTPGATPGSSFIQPSSPGMVGSISGFPAGSQMDEDEEYWQHLLAIGTSEGKVAIHRFTVPKECCSLPEIKYDRSGDLDNATPAGLTALAWLAPLVYQGPHTRRSLDMGLVQGAYYYLLAGSANGSTYALRTNGQNTEVVHQLTPSSLGGPVEQLALVAEPLPDPPASRHYHLVVGHGTDHNSARNTPGLAYYTLDTDIKVFQARELHVQSLVPSGHTETTPSKWHLLALSAVFNPKGRGQIQGHTKGTSHLPVQCAAITASLPTRGRGGYLSLQAWQFTGKSSSNIHDSKVHDLSPESILDLSPVLHTSPTGLYWLLLTPHHLLGHDMAPSTMEDTTSPAEGFIPDTSAQPTTRPELDIHHWFNFHPEVFPYQTKHIQAIRHQRTELGGRLFVDRLLQKFNLPPSQTYPPRDATHFRKLLLAILEAEADMTTKYMLMYYFLCDYESATLLKGFDSEGYLPVGLQLVVGGYWAVDHRQFELAFRYLSHPAVELHWGQDLLDVFIRNEKYLIALQFLRVLRDTTQIHVEPTVQMKVLLHCSLEDAFSFQRECALEQDTVGEKSMGIVATGPRLASSKRVSPLFNHMLDFVFDHPEKEGYLETLLGLPYTIPEETHLVHYCQSPKSSTLVKEFLLIYFIQHGRLVEAVQLHEAIKIQERVRLDQPAKTGGPSATGKANRFPLIENLMLILPQVQKNVLDLSHLVPEELDTEATPDSSHLSTHGAAVETIPFMHQLPTTPARFKDTGSTSTDGPITPSRMHPSPIIPPLSASRHMHQLKTPLSMFKRRHRPMSGLDEIQARRQSRDTLDHSLMPQLSLLTALSEQIQRQSQPMNSTELAGMDWETEGQTTPSKTPSDTRKLNSAQRNSLENNGTNSRRGTPQMYSPAHSPFLGPPTTPRDSSTRRAERSNADSPLHRTSATPVKRSGDSDTYRSPYSPRTRQPSDVLPGIRSPLRSSGFYRGKSQSAAPTTPFNGQTARSDSRRAPPAGSAGANRYFLRSVTPRSHQSTRTDQLGLQTPSGPTQALTGGPNMHTPRRSARLRSHQRHLTEEPTPGTTPRVSFAHLLESTSESEQDAERIPGTFPKRRHRASSKAGVKAATPRESAKASKGKETGSSNRVSGSDSSGLVSDFSNRKPGASTNRSHKPVPPRKTRGARGRK